MNEIRCEGTYRGSRCNRFLGAEHGMKGMFVTKCERCNGYVTIIDGKIASTVYKNQHSTQFANTGV